MHAQIEPLWSVASRLIARKKKTDAGGRSCSHVQDFLQLLRTVVVQRRLCLVCRCARLVLRCHVVQLRLRHSLGGWARNEDRTLRGPNAASAKECEEAETRAEGAAYANKRYLLVDLLDLTLGVTRSTVSGPAAK